MSGDYQPVPLEFKRKTPEEMEAISLQLESDLSSRRSVREFSDETFPREWLDRAIAAASTCLLYTSPSPRDRQKSRMPSSA